MTTLDTSSIDSLLDGTLDDLADVPEFKPFPIGTHAVTIKWEIKTVNDKAAVELTLTALETLQLADTSAEPVKAGDSTSVLFQLVKKDGTPNEVAQGQWKGLLAPLAVHFGTASNRETMEASNGATVAVTTGVRTSTNKDTKEVRYYTSVNSLTII